MKGRQLKEVDTFSCLRQCSNHKWKKVEWIKWKELKRLTILSSWKGIIKNKDNQENALHSMYMCIFSIDEGLWEPGMSNLICAILVKCVY